MNRANTVFWFVWIMIFTIEAGYFLGAQSQVVLWGIPWTMIRCALFIFGIILGMRWLLARVNSGTSNTQNQRWPSGHGLRLFAGILVILGLYGYTIGRAQSIRADEVLGKPIIAIARVTNASSSNPNILSLQLEGLTLQGDNSAYLIPSSGLHPCAIQATWWHGVRVNVATLVPGTRVVVSGMLVDSIQSESNAGLLPSKTYGFRGTVRSVLTTHSIFSQVKSALDATIHARMTGQGTLGGLLEGMVFGGGTSDNTVKQDFLSAGLLHVLVASGANVVLLEGFADKLLYPIWRVCRLPFALWFVTISLAIWGYTGICGFDASIVRAAWMANYRIAGRFVGRRSSIQGGMAFSALCIALSSPGQLFTISSVFSFLATFAIGKVIQSDSSAHKTKTHVSTWWKVVCTAGNHIWLGLKISMCIEVVLTPVLLWSFGQLTPYSIVSNLIVEPLLMCLLPIAAAWILFAVLSEHTFLVSWLADCFQAIAVLGVQQLLKLVRFISSLPCAMLVVPKPPILAILAFYGLVISLSLILRRWKSARP